MSKGRLLSLFFLLLGLTLFIASVYFYFEPTDLHRPMALPSFIASVFFALLSAFDVIKGLISKDSPKIEINKNVTNYNFNARPPIPNSLHQIPLPPHDFIGRRSEIFLIDERIKSGNQMIGLFGEDGIGKTSLGLFVSTQFLLDYPDGQIFVDMKGSSKQSHLTYSHVMTYVVRSFKPEKFDIPENELEGLYRSILFEKHIILFLDNVYDEEQVAHLTPLKDSLIIITSQKQFVLPGLYCAKLDSLQPDDAKTLVQRIAPLISDYDASELARVCNYFPLAVRLAASSLALHKELIPQKYINRLKKSANKLGLIEASIKTSYDLLEPSLQYLFRQLGVFSGIFALDDASAVWAKFDFAISSDEEVEVDTESAQVLIDSLLTYSMVSYDKVYGFYRINDFLRLYAEKLLLQDFSDSESAFSLHSFYTLYKMAKLVKDFEKAHDKNNIIEDLYHVKDQLLSIWVRLSPRFKNRWGRVWFADTWLSMLPGVVSIFFDNFTLGEQKSICEDALEASVRLKNSETEKVNLMLLGIVYERLGEPESAIEQYVKSMSIAKHDKDETLRASVNANFGTLYLEAGNLKKSAKYFADSAKIARKIPNKDIEAMSLGNLGILRLIEGDEQSAKELTEKALKLAEEGGDLLTLAHILCKISNVLENNGKFEDALKYNVRALEIFHKSGNKYSEASTLGSIGNIFWYLGNKIQAFTYYKKALVMARELGDRGGEGIYLANIALVLMDYQQAEAKAEAVALFKQAIIISRETHNPYSECEQLGNLSGLYQDLKNYKMSFDCLSKALDISRRIGNKSREGAFLSNLGSLYYKIRDLY
jgi:tetratricopeptide (TPR) repeat protein